MYKIPDDLNFWVTILLNKQDRDHWLSNENEYQKQALTNVIIYLKEYQPFIFNKIEGNKLIKNMKIPLKKILVVDDTHVNLILMKEILSQWKVCVLTAIEGEEALEIVKKEEPDLIILDLMMPKMDGYKVCGLLKNNKKYKDIPIIIWTAVIGKEQIKIWANQVR